jgi:DNA-binding HxlR family transcriptional regulator/putative sterol carrier protein
MGVRRYNQHCGLARALDVVGDRWTLLVLRELIGGPKRYKHLLAGLPGAGTGMLATRLKSLEEEGIVRRTMLPPPAEAQVYELTELGRELEPVLVGLTRFGFHWLGSPSEDEACRPSWLAIAMRARFDPEAARGVRETYELRLEDGLVLRVRVDDGSAEIAEGPAGGADVTLRADTRTLLQLLARELHPRDALADGRLEIEGDRDALLRWNRMFPARAAAAAAA